MMTIEPAHKIDVFNVAKDMRTSDYDEFSAVSFEDNRTSLARLLAERYGSRPDVLVGTWKDHPVCIGGFLMTRPGVVTLLFFATDDFHHIGLGVTRFIRKNLFPRLEREGVHRFEAVSMATHTAAHKWLGTLGLKAETEPMRGYGRAGEAYIQFSKVRDVRPAGA